MSSHRLFAQLAFERALGHAALDTLRQAVVERDQFLSASTWGKEELIADHNQADFWGLAGELDQIVGDRTRDVLNGPGLGVVGRGEYFQHQNIVELVQAARDRRDAPS
jgi:hypothetical protein